MEIKYQCENKFIVRIPTMPYSVYDEIIELKKNKREMKKFVSEKYGERLLINSSNLFNMIKEKKINASACEGIMKYLIRTMTRTTPYGGNVGVYLGEFDFKNSQKVFELSKEIEKKAQTDFEWTFKVIKKYEKLLGERLLVKRNNTILEKNFYYCNIWSSCFSEIQNNQETITHINKSNVVKLVLENATKFISINEIILIILKQYKNVEKSIIQEMIFTLLEKEYLISDLRPNLLSKEDCLKQLIKKLRCYDITDAELEKINYNIDEYNDTQLESKKAIDTYQEIITNMKKRQDSNNYLKVDCYGKEIIKIPDLIKEELQEFVTTFSQLFSYSTYNDYILKFQEKYGNQAVKMLDVFDEINGIGFPMKDKDALYLKTLEILIYGVLNNNTEKQIDLSTLNFPDLPYEKEQKYLNPNIELCFYIKTKKNGFQYILSPIIGGNSNQSINGRFDFHMKCNANKESNQIKDVDLSYFSNEARIVNVLQSEITSNAYLFLGNSIIMEGKEAIDINDIYIYVNNNQLEFIQKSTKEILNFRKNNVVSNVYYPKILEKCLEISDAKTFNITYIFAYLKEILEKFRYLPQITYKNVVISPESWKVTVKDFTNKRGNIVNDVNFMEEFRRLAQEKKFKKKMYFGFNDQRILLSIEDDMHLNIIRKMLNSHKQVSIYNLHFENQELNILDREKNKHISEYVFSFFAYNLKEKKEKAFVPNNFIDASEIQETMSTSLDEWVTIKIYLEKYEQDYFIKNVLRELYSEYIHDKNLFEKMYFLRYFDGRSHIRIRIKRARSLNDTLNRLEIKNILNSYGRFEIILDTYFPEINRYGGREIWSKVEEIFALQSYMFIEILNILDEVQVEYSKNTIFFLSIIKMIQDMEISYKDMEKYLKKYEFNKSYSDGFKKFLSNFSEDIYERDLWNELSASVYGQRIYTVLSEVSQNYWNFWKDVEKTYDKNFLRKQEILMSLIHMIHNRLIGIVPENEKKMMVYLKKYFYKATFFNTR